MKALAGSRSSRSSESAFLREALGKLPARYINVPVFGLGGVDRVSVAFLMPEAAREALKFLVQSLIEQYVVPGLECDSRASLMTFLGKRWHEYDETLKAIHAVLARSASEEKALHVAEQSVDDMTSELLHHIRPFAGDSAALEVEFAAQTYRRSVALVSQFRLMPPPADVDRDWDLCAQHQQASAIYLWAFLALDLVDQRSKVRSPEVLATIFELLRAGALEAYACAREALEIRKPPKDAQLELGEQIPFDSEDEVLSEVGVNDPLDDDFDGGPH